MEKQTATDLFISRSISIQNKITALRCHSVNHFGKDSETISWGDCGDLGHIEEMLGEVIAFIEGE